MSKFTWCHIILSVTGVILGLSGSITFFIYENNDAFFWAFISAVLAFLNFHLLYLEISGKLEEWHSVETMGAIMSLSMCVFIMISGIMAYFLFRIFYEHLPVYPIKGSLVIATVWTFMSAKWVFCLYRLTKRLQKELDETFIRLIT